jgi:HD superfamily phosphohydrolase
MRLYRDPVHGDILLSALAADLIDTPEFQRLGRIMQLGFAHLVYRGATHTRFAHAVGTYWVSREILRHVHANHARLGLPLPASPFTAAGQGGLTTADLAEIVSAAALLHDLTHIPFGHTLEDELQDIYLKHDALESPRLFFLLFDPRSSVARVFDRPGPYVPGLDNSRLRWLIYLTLAFREDADASPPRSFPDLLDAARESAASATRLAAPARAAHVEFFAAAAAAYRDLTARGLFQPFMSDLVSGTVSADLLDYTARDLFYTGVRGDFDQRLLHYFFIGRDGPAGAPRLALDVLSPRGYARIDITSEIMNLMRLRYSMAERVYYHKNKVAASAMLARGLAARGLPGETNPYDDPDSVLAPALSDETIVHRLAGSAESRDLGQSILNRQLYVPAAVLSEPLARELGAPEKFVDFFRGRPDGRRRLFDLQAELSALTGLGPHGVIVYCPPRKMQAKAIAAPVRFEENRIIPLSDHPDFHDEAELLNRKYQGLWKAFAFVHPAALRRPGLVSSIAETFCRRLSIPPAFARRLAAM